MNEVLRRRVKASRRDHHNALSPGGEVMKKKKYSIPSMVFAWKGECLTAEKVHDLAPFLPTNQLRLQNRIINTIIIHFEIHFKM